MTRFRHAGLNGVARTVRALRLPANVEWRLKALFFGAFGWALRGSRHLAEFEEARRWRSRASHVEASTLPAPSHEEELLVFGIVDWDFRIQRPQHLTRELARSAGRTFYVGPGFVRTERPGYRVRRVLGEPEIHEIQLHAPPGCTIYSGGLSGSALEFLTASLRSLLGDLRLGRVRLLLTHPGWWPIARLVPRVTSVYDCMDNHHGFADAAPALLQDEALALAETDALVVTSAWLEERMRGRHPRTSLVRNGCSPEHFAAIPANEDPRPCVGYFGAIAEWFDVDLLVRVAEELPELHFLLVGADTVDAGRRFDRLENIERTGELPYDELPAQLARMDVLAIPFRINDLTRATNPVKAYEALAAGRPVIATPMPELEAPDFSGEVLLAAEAAEFVAAIRAALPGARDPAQMQRRRDLAAKHSWASRAARLADAYAEPQGPRFSHVIVSWNGASLTERCVRSIIADEDSHEILVVDNASTDETPEVLDRLEREHSCVRTIRNTENLGFGPAVNQGLAAATGDVLVVLNNDIVLTPGWTRTLGAHLRRNGDIGMLGPVTNNIGNEARIPTEYRDLDAMELEQRSWTGRHAGRLFDIRVAALFCAALRREVYDAIGGLDEGYTRGFFEDDDYAERVRRAGWRVVCAEDVFVHHDLSASFGRLQAAERQALFERNREYFESKWGPWQPHVYRDPDGS